MSFLKNQEKEINTLFKILQSHVKTKFGEDVDTIEKLKIKSRNKHLVYFRRMLMIILGETFLKKYNQDDIASVVGLDRTSFIYHCKVHMNDYSVLKNYKEEYNSLRDSYLEEIEI